MELADFTIIDELFLDFSLAHPSPALTYAIVSEGNVIHQQVFGFAKVSEGIPTDNDTSFRIASMTKSFTAAAILLLRDQGSFSLDSEIGALLTTLTLDPTTTKTTVRELLTMSAGFPTDDPWADRFLGIDENYLNRLLSAPMVKQQNAQPKYSYSNFGYMLLGKLIATVSNQSVHSFIIEHICTPLGMESTRWNNSDIRQPTASGYCRRENEWSEEAAIECQCSGDTFAGLWSNTSDLAKWTQFLHTSSKTLDAKSPVKRESILELQYCYTPMPDSFQKLHDITIPQKQAAFYGFGLRTFNLGGRVFCGHSGGLPGFGSHMRWDKESGLGVVALANSTYCPVWNPCASALELLTRKRIKAPIGTISPKVTQRNQEIISLLEQWNDLAADTLFDHNFFLDRSRPDIKAGFEAVAQLFERSNYEMSSTAVESNLTELRFKTNDHEVVLEYSLSPTALGKIQSLKLEMIETTSESFRQILAFLGEINRDRSTHSSQMLCSMVGEIFAFQALSSKKEDEAVFRIVGSLATTTVKVLKNVSGFRIELWS